MSQRLSLTERIRLVAMIAADQCCKRAHLAIAFLLFCRFFNSENGRCDPSVGTLAREAGTGHRHAQQAIRDLEQWGYLHVETSAGTPGKFGRTNAYTPCVPAQGARGSAGGDPMRYSTPDALEQTNPLRPSAPEYVIEPVIGPPSSPATRLFAIAGGFSEKAVKRESRPFKASAGCTIDSYQPDPVRMGAWAKQNAPDVRDPVGPAAVEAIKDAWRSKGLRIKDFDATYRNYLRGRQKWASERQPTGSPDDQRRRIGMC